MRYQKPQIAGIHPSVHRSISFTIVCLIAVLYSSCEVVVDVDLPEQDAPLVVNSFFTPDSLWQVNLSSGLPFDAIQPSFTERFAHVNAADISIWQNETQIPAQFRAQGNGQFVADTRPEAGQSYTIRVAAEGFDDVEGIGSIPTLPQVVSFDAAQGSFEYQNGLDIELRIDDPADQDNFYALYAEIYQENTDRVTGEPRWPAFSSLIGMMTSDPVLADQEFLDIEETYVDEAYFTDDLFAGRPYTLDFSVAGFPFNDPNSDVLFETTLTIYLLSISEDLYRYKRSANQQEDVGEDPFSEPVEIHSNMSNKVGIFAGYQAVKFTLNPDSLINF